MKITEGLPVKTVWETTNGILALLKKYGLNLYIIDLKGCAKYVAISRSDDSVIGSLWRTNLHGKSKRKVKKELKKFLRQYSK